MRENPYGKPFDASLTVDVEDWFHVCNLPGDPDIPFSEWRVFQNVEKLLKLLDRYRVSATFFVLGTVAERLPGLAPLIASAGHEVASHGFSHRLVPAIGEKGFRDELRRTADILESQTGRRPLGYRAPQWSLSSEATPWAFNILRQEGYLYDSSLNPLRFVGDRRGSRVPFRLETAGGNLWEIPPLVTPSMLGNLPTGGGWGFRLFPRRLLETTIQGLNRQGAPAVLYLHPRELDPDGPRLKLSPLRSFVAYGPRRDATPCLAHFLARRRFGTVRQLVESWESA